MINGLRLMHGNLNIFPISQELDVSFSTASRVFRESGWPVPPNVHIFSDNGAGDLFGFWLGNGDPDCPPIVEFGQLFEHGCMAIVGTTLDRFLRWWTAYYLQVCDAPSKSLDVLEVPDPLRSSNPDDELIAKLCRWVDPTLPRIPPSPYRDRLTPEQVPALLDQSKV